MLTVAPYTHSDYYSPVPTVLPLSDKSEKSNLGWRIQVIIEILILGTHKKLLGSNMGAFGLLLATDLQHSGL